MRINLLLILSILGVALLSTTIFRQSDHHPLDNVLAADTEEAPIESRPMPEIRVDMDPLTAETDAPVLTHADMLETVTPAVVGVHTSRIVSTSPRDRRMNPLEDFMRRYYGLPERREERREAPPDEGVEERRVPSGMGSGVLISADGYILTNHHVISAGRSREIADEILVSLDNGDEFHAEVIGSDPQTDVAVLKIEVDRELPFITFADSDAIRVGDITFAVGNPLDVGLTVTKGIVSAVRRTDLGILGRGTYENFIQTDASINLGNSGGPLVDARGRLIGINTAIMSRTGGNIGIGFAIPSNLARNVMENLLETGTVARGFLGVYLTDLTRDLADSFDFDSTRGALIQQVQEGTAAHEAGIQHGDIITAFNGRRIQSASELRVLVSQTRPGTTVTFTVFRAGETMEIEVTLGTLGDEEVASVDDPETREVIPGVAVREITPELRSSFEIPDDLEGVVVTEITRRRIANEPFNPGMVISEVNGNEVRSIEDLETHLREGVNRLYIWEEGQRRYIAYRLESD